MLRQGVLPQGIGRVPQMPSDSQASFRADSSFMRLLRSDWVVRLTHAPFRGEVPGTDLLRTVRSPVAREARGEHRVEVIPIATREAHLG